MKLKSYYLLTSIFMLVGICGVANADLRSDNFNDNTQGTMWKLLEEDSDDIWLEETNKRLEARATSEAYREIAAYLSNDWGFVTAENFQVKIGFYYDRVSWDWGEVGIGIGFGDNVENFRKDYISIGAGCDENYPVFYYEVVTDSNVIESGWTARVSNRGVLYVSYDARGDNLYLSTTGYGSANAWKTISGVVRGQWNRTLIGVGIIGYSSYVDLGSGQAYLDNFIIDSGTLCTNKMAADLNEDCKVDFQDFVLLALEWLNCNMDPPESCL